MPSVGRIQKLSALGIAAATLGITASAASAATNDVWLWACHGSASQQLGTSPFVKSPAGAASAITAYGDGCVDGDTAGGFGGGGLTATLGAAAVPGQGEAGMRLDVPPGLTLDAVQLSRHTSGFGTPSAGNPQRYTAKTSTATLESVSLADGAPADFDGERRFDDATGSSVSIGVKCENPLTVDCAAAGPVSVDVSRVGLKVLDTTTPGIAVGNSRSPASGTPKLELDVRASDTGSGLQYAEAYLGGSKVSEAQFTADRCVDLSPADPTRVDLPLGEPCEMVGKVTLPVITTDFPDAKGYVLVVKVFDWAGNEAFYTQTVEVLNNVNLGTNVRTLNIGTTGVVTPPASTNPNTSGSGGVAGAGSQSCRSPRLSFALAQKPMRVSKGVPVLQRSKRYRFAGRLTCVINGKRRSAPKRTRIDIFNKVGKRTTERAGTTVADKGKLSIILAYARSRTITFRFTNSDGQRSQVSIKVKVEKKKSSR